MSATKAEYYKDLSVGAIRRDGGTQARVGNHEETIEQYAEEMKAGQWVWSAQNAVVVFRDEDGRHWLGDGFHRVEACQRAFGSGAEVHARVVAGDLRAARLYAAGANAAHGLRRNRDDVRRAIKTLLKDEEWGRWSDAEIARQVRCSDKTVAKVRAELIASSEIPRIEERTVNRNGKTYQQAVPPASQVEISAQDISAEFPGWRWNHRGVDWQMRAPDGWHTGWYYKPERAVAEARRRMLSMPKAATPDTAQAQPAYLASIATANNPAGLNALRLQIAADKVVSEEQHSVLQQAISERLEQLAKTTDVTAVCFDCGATDDVLIVNGAAGHLCRSCATKRNPNLVTSEIKLLTASGVVGALPVQRSADIAMHRATKPGQFAITHIGTGRSIHTFGDQAQAEAAFDQLAQLDWSDMHGEMASFRLAGQIVAILGQELPGREQQRRDDLMRRAEAIGCAIFGASNNYCLVRGGATIASSSGDLNTLDQLIGTLERAEAAASEFAISDVARRENESDARGIWPEMPSDRVPVDWDLWRGRASAAGLLLRIVSPEIIDLRVRGADKALIRASKGFWDDVTDLICKKEQAAAPAVEEEDVVEDVVEEDVVEEDVVEEQVSPPVPAIPRDVLISHAAMIFSAIIERASPEELRVLHCLHFGQSFVVNFSLADDLWESVTHWLPSLTTEDLAWIKTGRCD